MRVAKVVEQARNNQRSISIDDPSQNSSQVSSLFVANKAKFKGPRGEYRFLLPPTGADEIDIQIGRTEATASDYPSELKRIKFKILEELESHDVAIASNYNQVLQDKLKTNDEHLEDILLEHFHLHRSEGSSDHQRSIFDSSILANGFSKKKRSRSR